MAVHFLWNCWKGGFMSTIKIDIIKEKVTEGNFSYKAETADYGCIEDSSFEEFLIKLETLILCIKNDSFVGNEIFSAHIIKFFNETACFAIYDCGASEGRKVERYKLDEAESNMICQLLT